MEEVKAYKPCCCNKAYLNKSSARTHEYRCPYNPKNHACATCGYNSKEQETVYVPPHGDQNYGDADYERYYHWCNYFEKELAESAIYDQYPDKYVQLTINCEHWKSKEESECQ